MLLSSSCALGLFGGSRDANGSWLWLLRVGPPVDLTVSDQEPGEGAELAVDLTVSGREPGV